MKKLLTWLNDNVQVLDFEKGYQSVTFLTWMILAFFGMLILGFSIGEVGVAFMALACGAQFLSIVQEVVRWVFAKKTGKGEQSFKPGNICADIVGVVYGSIAALLTLVLFG